MSESDLRDANLRADKLQAQRDAAVALLRKCHTHMYPDITAHPLTEDIKAFLETL